MDILCEMRGILLTNRESVVYCFPHLTDNLMISFTRILYGNHQKGPIHEGHHIRAKLIKSNSSSNVSHPKYAFNAHNYFRFSFFSGFVFSLVIERPKEFNKNYAHKCNFKKMREKRNWADNLRLAMILMQ